MWQGNSCNPLTERGERMMQKILGNMDSLLLAAILVLAQWKMNHQKEFLPGNKMSKNIPLYIIGTSRTGWGSSEGFGTLNEYFLSFLLFNKHFFNPKHLWNASALRVLFRVPAFHHFDDFTAPNLMRIACKHKLQLMTCFRSLPQKITRFSCLESQTVKPG